jgi:hypothetical protein
MAIANATGGATAAALTADLKDLAGAGLSKTGVFKIIASDNEYRGGEDMNANVTFINATLGSILATAAGWAIVKADSSGNFACTASNAVDETVWFAASSCEGGHDALANGVLIRGCVPDSAAWSA